VTLRSRVSEAVASLRAGGAVVRPAVGIVLGSGLGALADEVDAEAAVPYSQIPHCPVPTAAGHHGRLVLGRFEGHPVAVLQGRAHLYEGYTADQVTFPIRVLAALGARTLIVTNAAGGINREFRTGDLMIISDHINFSGTNPLVGPNDDTLGPRFPDMSQAYDRALRDVAEGAARDERIPVRTGVYVGLLGPSYETPAEIEMLARWGADAVGMSTVAEVIVARHAGLRVLGIAAITNAISRPPHPPAPVTHDEVLAASRTIEPRFIRLMRTLMRGLPD
jgi:purine-nucleoside phosphorylase